MTTQLNKSSFINEPDLNSKIIITGASPDRINRNTILRKFVLEGFIAAIGLKNVYECPLEIVSEMAIKKKPKLIIFFGSCMPDQSNYFEIRKVADKLKIDLAFWVHDDPYEFDYSYKLDTIADYIFSNDKWSSMHYSHPKIFHLPLAGSASHHFRPWKNKKKYDLFFCGVGFSNRIKLLKELSKHTKNIKKKVVGSEWPSALKCAKNIRLTNHELSEAYSQSSITLNIGRHFDLANSKYQIAPSTPGPRTFEAALAGTVQFYYVESLEIVEYFKPNDEIILFNDPLDFKIQLERLLDNAKLIKKIAIASQNRALKDHTYIARAQNLLSKVKFN